MNGPEHYREADRLLEQTQRELEHATPNTINEVLAVAAVSVAKAQAHAALALAAAQAANYAIPVAQGETGRGWAEIAAVRQAVTA